MKTHAFPRVIHATAAASLSFGAAACGEEDGSSGGDESSSGSLDAGDGNDDPSADGQALENQLRAFSRSVCESFMRCDAADFAASFDDLDSCIRYYDDYYSDEYGTLLSQRATDPAACEGALVDLFDCYTGLYNTLSCEEIYCDYYSDPNCEVEWCEAEYLLVESACNEPS